MKKTLATLGLVTSLATASVAPVIPSGDMVFTSAALYEIDSFQELVSATGTPQALKEKFDRIKSYDKDNDKVVAVATFLDSDGVEHEVTISKERYLQMGEVEGQVHNPKKTEYQSLIEKTVKPKKAEAAWAYDNSQWNTGTGASSYTFSYTTGTLTNGLMVLSANFANSFNFTSVTYNGSATTLVGSQIGDGSSVKLRTHYQLAPASGAHNVVWTLSGAGGLDAVTATYSGIVQTSPLDASYTTWDGVTSNNANYSHTLTTTANDTLCVWHFTNFSGDTTITGSSGTTVRQNYPGGAGNFGTALADEDCPTSGTQTMNVGTGNGGSDWYGNILASFKEAAEAAAPDTQAPIIFN